MQNLLKIWQGLDMRRRAVIAGATLAMFVAVLAMSRLAGTSGMALLYAGLEEANAGEVIAVLEQRGVAYEVRGNAIYVEEASRDALRMELAAEGLPANAGTGYELLDGLSGFGTTAQMFDAAYWRAKEGELARTILANPQIRAARVHIAQAPAQPFQRDIRPSASVTVTTSGGTVPAAQARALRHLVAAAVPGMLPEDVAVIDSVGGLIAADNDPASPAAAADSRAEEIRQNVARLLAARVGAGKAVVEVAVDVVTDSEQISERRLDPQGRVAISSETEQKAGSTSDNAGDVTVASNLPANNAAGGGTQNQSSESRERVNFEVSETSRELVRAPGAVRRITVAVLVDGQNVTAADGTVTFQPRPETELADLRELVSAAAGLDTARGDVLTLKSLPFEPAPVLGEMAAASMFELGEIDVMALIQTGILALVVLVLGLFVIRPILTNASRRPALSAAPALLALPDSSSGGATVLTGEIDEGEGPALALSGGEAADPMQRLRRLIEERQAESIEILRGWMELEEEPR